jgi:hypothetical protein
MTRNGEFLFDQAIRAFREIGGRLIVEVGAIRNREWLATDGHSTLRWPHGATLWSVDNNAGAPFPKGSYYELHPLETPSDVFSYTTFFRPAAGAAIAIEFGNHPFSRRRLGSPASSV